MPQFCLAEAQDVPLSENYAKLTIDEAFVCADVVNSIPQGMAAVFSLHHGTISCFTKFSQIPKKTAVCHSWYHKDSKVSQVKLKLQPPQWSTYSSITLREADKGPWRVEVTDANNRLLGVVRFSVVD